MGVTIHYRGQLDDLGKLNILCDELTQVAEKMDWAYNCLDEDSLINTCRLWEIIIVSVRLCGSIINRI